MIIAVRMGLFILCTALLGGCVGTQNRSDNLGLGGAKHSREPIYRLMTDNDVSLANAALDRSLERNLSGKRASWRNRGSGNHGSITPLRTYRASNGGYCRDYEEELVIGSDSELYTATACRDPLGLWQPIN